MAEALLAAELLRKPAEKSVTTRGPTSFMRTFCWMTLLRSSRPRRGMFLSRASDTFRKPGSLPTSKAVVFPEMADVTRAPKRVNRSFALALPSSRPAPPPSSGKIPVTTTVFPARAPATAPSTPATGYSHSCFCCFVVTSACAAADCVWSSRSGTLDSSATCCCCCKVVSDFLVLRAQFDLSIAWRTSSSLRASSSSGRPLNNTEFIASKAATKVRGSWHVSGSGRPIHTLDGTRQQPRWFHRVYDPVSSCNEPTRTSPFAMSSAPVPHFFAAPFCTHLLLFDLASSTRYVGTASPE
mmetsp:Transcript_12329/g.40320  ORF Transcript_12329/g.40320 Transcript_12329/m.40320 type:complete len:297 (-) Transcript_12329:564-1454(-)